MSQNQTKIKASVCLRKDTLENWSTTKGGSKILKDGEIAIVVDEDNSVNFKLGDGITAFSELPYITYTEVVGKKITGASVVASLSICGGLFTEATGSASACFGNTAKSSHAYSFTWNGDGISYSIINPYTSHGSGTFNINPTNGIEGFYIGERTFKDYLDDIDQIQSDWNQSDSTKKDFIKNKPTLSGQTFDLNVKGDYFKMCVAVARVLGANVLHVPSDFGNITLSDLFK